MLQFPRFFSTDSHKAIKARGFGYLNAINYLAPSTLSGAGNVCPHASTGCLALCLGWFSGQAGMARDGELNSVRSSRIAKTRLFFDDRAAFMRELIAGVKRAQAQAARLELALCVRLNGSSDIPFEAIAADSTRRSVFELFPHVQFVDYTKSVKRALRFAAGKMPPNYHLTFSRSETNESDCLRVLAAGGAVTVVSTLARPEAWNGYRTVDGDAHDLRHLDGPSVVVWLAPKGNKAKRDSSGFVVR